MRVSEYLASTCLKSESNLVELHKNLTPSSLSLMLRLGSHQPPIPGYIGRILTGPRASTSLCSQAPPPAPEGVYM